MQHNCTPDLTPCHIKAFKQHFFTRLCHCQRIVCRQFWSRKVHAWECPYWSVWKLLIFKRLLFQCYDPGCRIPPGACSQISRWLRACENAYFVTSVKSRQNTAILIASFVVIRLFWNQLLWGSWSLWRAFNLNIFALGNIQSTKKCGYFLELWESEKIGKSELI